MASPLSEAATYSAPASAGAGHAPGDLIARKYRLERLLGEGAQGSVWLAENLALGSAVALKIVHAGDGNPAATLRLEKEARAAAQIGHPAVVRVFDLGRTAHGDAFIVMEFLEGENLGERLAARGRLPPVEAVRTLLPIADVLDAAHARGIVHRDLKPENVFLEKNGGTVQPKLLDFGIAKFRDPRRSLVITEVGTLLGSPGYVAPEQALCRADVGPAVDVWAFCVVLYECVTGVVPFEADDCRELFRSIGEDPPRPTLAYGVGDLELWEILRRGLAKDPRQRWPTLFELGRALARWLAARGVQDDVSGVLLKSRWLAKGESEPRFSPARPPSPPARAWTPLPGYAVLGAALAIAALAVGAGATLALFFGSREAEPSLAAPAAHLPGTSPLPPAPKHGDTKRSAEVETVSTTRLPPAAAAPGAVQERAAVPEAPRRTQRAAVNVPDGGVPRTMRAKRRPPKDLLNPY
jgi:eukaryotic-like serine/threonine-protein kinase